MGSGETEEGEEVDRSAVIVSGETSKMLKFVEAAFDSVALAVEKLSRRKTFLRLAFDGITAFMPAALTVSRMALLS